MNKACKIGVLLINIVNNRKIELNKFFEGFKTFFSHMFIGTSFSLRSNCVNVPKLANPRKKIRNVVLTSVRTASMYLSSSTPLSGLVRWNRFSNNYITQWLIGIFVRSYSSKDYLINCAGVRQLKSFGEPFQPEPKNKDAKQF